MKKAVSLLFAFFAASASFAQEARENPYDLLGKVLLPIVNVLSPKAPRRALLLDAHLLQAGKLPPEFQNQAVHLALNAPDRLLLSAPLAGEMMTVCRDGDDLWATPGSKIQYLAGPGAAPDNSITPAATPQTGKPKKKKKHGDQAGKGAAALMGPLQLPIPEKELVFLPILFEVADGGDQQIAGRSCQILDVRLMPQLAQSLHVENWSARLWVDPERKLVQIAVTGPNWNATAAIDKLETSESLPDETFQPQGTDVLHLTKAQFEALISRLGSR